MFRVTTQAIATLVINLFIAGDITEIVGSHNDVCCTRLTVNTDTAIASTTSFARSGASPDMTRGYDTVYSVTAVTDIYALHDTVADLLTSIRMRMLFGNHSTSRNSIACSRVARKSTISEFHRTISCSESEYMLRPWLEEYDSW
jgi:hypothetical protein